MLRQTFGIIYVHITCFRLYIWCFDRKTTCGVFLLKTLSHLLQFRDSLLITTQTESGFTSCFVISDVFLFANSSETLIELSQIIGIICAKSVIEEDFLSNYRKMAVLIKVLITEGYSIFGSFRLCLFTGKSHKVSPAWNQKYKLEQCFFF